MCRDESRSYQVRFEQVTYVMNKLLLLIATMTCVSSAYALPPCPQDLEVRWHNCQGTYTYADGNQYVGEFRDDKKHGQGIFIFGSESQWAGAQYVGEFRDDKYHGQGTYILANGDKYVGEFRDDKKHGQGIFIFGSESQWTGAQYVGEFRDDKYHGQGTYTHANGAQYVGEFRDDKYHGQGTFTYANGDKYAGEWRHDKYHGQGTLTSATGDKYVGEFRDGVAIEGPSVEEQRGAEYALPLCPQDLEVRWHNCQGTYTYADGNQYVGDFRDDKKHGQGIFMFGSESQWAGAQYVGEFRDDKFHGQGTYTYANGAQYVGEFRDDKYRGQGTLTYANGDKYVGEWRHDKYHGQGTLTSANGDKYVGEFRDGVAIEWPTVEEQRRADSNDLLQASSGSGFAVSREGYVITNNHVIKGCQNVVIHHKGVAVPVTIVAYDTQNDLALLKGDFSPDHVFPIRRDNPGLMEDVYVAGFPFGETFNSAIKITKGIVSAQSGLGNNFSQIQIDAALQPGNSGGPILDEFGNVIAVAVAKLDLKFAIDEHGVIPENTNFGIKSSVVRSILDSQRVNMIQEADSVVNKRQLSDQITKGTYYISCWMTSAQMQEMTEEKVMFENIE
ncbi:MAG: trypsin-like peptidase domain-containing protein, partial [Proteobacteria bacterium]|nr:trypsin-like peptidase domain-containing protein [Pseudomonadota bacterium]